MDHLRKQHHIPVNLRAAVRSLVSTLPSLDIADLPSGWDGYPPLKALRVVDAFQCKHCRFIRRDITDVRKHINKENMVFRHLVLMTRYRLSLGLVVGELYIGG